MTNKNRHSPVPVNEIIGFLEVSNSTALEALRNDNSDFEELLKTGIKLGDKDDKTSENQMLSFKLDISEKGLAEIHSKSVDLKSIIKKRLKVRDRLQLISQVIVAFCGASVISTLVKESDSFRYLVGGLSLAASILTIFTKQQSGQPYGKSGLIKTLNSLSENHITAKQYLDEISIIKQLPIVKNEKRVISLIGECNRLSKETHLLIDKFY